MRNALSCLFTALVIAAAVGPGCGDGGGGGDDEAPARFWVVDRGADQTTILRSDDRGRSWNVVHAVPFGPGFVNAVAFRDRDHGVAAGGGFLATDDGGSSWTAQAIENPGLLAVGDIALDADTRAVAIGSGGLLTPNTRIQPGLFFMTVGAPWRRADVGAFAFPFTTAMRSVCVSASGAAVATGFGGENVGRHSFALLSTDAGMTWTAITDRLSEFTPDAQALQGTACVGASLWIVGENRVTRVADPPPPTPFMFHSTDAGATWTDESASRPTGLTGGLADVAFVDERNGWAAGFTGREDEPRPLVLHTNDGGGSWAVQELRGGDHGRLERIAFAQDGSGIVTGFVDPEMPPLVFVTVDGGATWRPIEIPGATNLTGLAIAP